VAPVERLEDQRRDARPAAAEEDRRDGDALGIVELG
jgi:hypothetical protein